LEFREVFWRANMKLDPAALRYLTRDDFRVLTSVEMGMKNHDLVPVELVTQIARLRLGGVHKILSTLLRYKLLHHDRSHFDGYRLTYLGYDFLALRTFLARDCVIGVGRQIGVGKESDIFIAINEEEEEICMKLHRLGRTSFRAIKNKRDYHKSRGSPSWLYLSRLAATKEYAFMKVLREYDFPVPEPIDHNRHVILMKLVDGFPLNQVRVLDKPEDVYVRMMELIERFAHHGLIHGDFNEFNVMISQTGVVTVIDFPQMVSINHPNARMYFERDVNCVRRFFRKRFNLVMDYKPTFDEVHKNVVEHLDVRVAASGFTKQMAKQFDHLVEAQNTSDANEDDEEEDDEEEGGEEDVQQQEVEEVQNEGAPSEANNTQENESDGEDDDNESDEESVGDGPSAYLLSECAPPPAVTSASEAICRAEATKQREKRSEGIREKVARDMGRTARNKANRGKSTRNTVKNKEKRKLQREAADRGAWF